MENDERPIIYEPLLLSASTARDLYENFDLCRVITELHKRILNIAPFGVSSINFRLPRSTTEEDFTKLKSFLIEKQYNVYTTNEANIFDSDCTVIVSWYKE